MEGGLLSAAGQPQGEQKQVDCVEIYMPKSLEFLSELYRVLREMVSSRFGTNVLDGFSVYEVDGVFRGERFWEQRTLVIRILFDHAPSPHAESIEARVSRLGRYLAAHVAPREEEIWICHYPQTVTIFRGVKRLFGQEER